MCLYQSHGGREIRRPGLHHPTISPMGPTGVVMGGNFCRSRMNVNGNVCACVRTARFAENPKFSSNVSRVTIGPILMLF